MATVIYCDRVKHIVEDAWDVVSEAIECVERDPEGSAAILAPGFIAVTRVGDDHQTYLRASAITSFHRLRDASVGPSRSTMNLPAANQEAESVIRALAASKRAPFLEVEADRARAIVAVWDG